ncbi:hypothetical protein OWV82_021964 [Melia azedarach]|uniref:Uncharacterized protein n=1 Tax=Melia azedarach TaxID=155640 RepID=A0ACC1X1T8_MELAZ|nr:hypothetical protein OWV82_021964 [Melia azedarach]
MQNHNMNIETCNQLPINMNKFPQPTRPINSYDLEIQRFPSESEPANMNNMNISEPSSSEESLPTASREEEEEKEETMEKVPELISELNEKLPSSIRSEVNLDHQINKLKGLKVYSTSTRTRGCNRPLEEIKCKLERFKIRTVQQGGGGGGGGVVQDEVLDKQ